MVSQKFAYGTYAVEGRQGLTYRSLQVSIEKYGYNSVDQVLGYLQSAYPGLFVNYILMYRTRSIQPASPTHPRVLLIGKGAKIVLAYHGNLKLPSSQTIEVMEFIEETNRFEFHEIRFDKKGKKVFSKTNSAKCLECHQAQSRLDVDPRPNWEPYSLWPGAFGSSGSHTVSNLSYDHRIRGEDQSFVDDHINEKSLYQFFKDNIKPTIYRYRILGPIDFHMTVRFTDALLSLNYRRVVRLAQKTSAYERYKYAFIAAARCRHLPWPEGIEKWHSESPLYSKKVQNAPPAEFPTLQTTPGLGLYGEIDIEEKTVPVQPPKYVKRRLSESISLIFDPLGFETSDWSTDFRTEGGRFAFRGRFGLPSDPRRKMFEAFQFVDPELASMSCKELEAMSLKALGPFLSDGGPQRMLESQLRDQKHRNAPVIELCTRCHKEPDDFDTPQIPFGSPKAMRSYLKTWDVTPQQFYDDIVYRTGAHAGEENQMPPRASLTEGQREQLLQYIQKLIP